MAIKISNQYSYTGKGPFDAKSLVENYDKLIDPATWTVDGSIIAYNGMVVSVWKAPNSGIYCLFDPNVVNSRQSPKVENKANWHKIADDSDISSIINKLGNVQNDTNLMELITDGIEAAKAYAKDYADTGDVAILQKVQEANSAFEADLSTLNDKIKSTDDIVAAIISRADSIESRVATTEGDIAELLSDTQRISSSIDTYASSLATLVGIDKDENGRADKSVRTIAAEEINAIIKASDPEGGKTIENIANLVEYVDTHAGEIAGLISSTNENIAKLAGIETTVVAAIEKAKKETKEEIINEIPKLEVATESTLGGIKSASGKNLENKVTVDAETGVASVNSVNVNTLTQTEGDTLVLNGGAAKA